MALSPDGIAREVYGLRKPEAQAMLAGKIRLVARAAENDALERAAGRAEAFDQNVADAIRAMKHEVTWTGSTHTATMSHLTVDGQLAKNND